MTTSTMQYIQMTGYGEPSVLQLNAGTLPQPQTGEVLIKIAAIGVNYADILRRRNTYFMPTPVPFVLGSEAVGEIIAVGADVDAPSMQVGNRVLAILPHGGGYATHALAIAQYCVPLPPQIDSAAATAIFVQGSTAHLMLHQTLGQIAGKTVLIHAAAGGVGSILVQLAKLAGATNVIGTGSSDKKLAIATSMGADAVVNYTIDGWPQRVIEANNGQKVDFILEMVGGEIYTQSFNCLIQGGTMVVYGAASGQKGFIHSEHFVDESHTVTGFNLAHFIQHKPELWQQALGAVIGLMATGKLQINVQDIFSLQDAAEAHRRLEARTTTGKVVLIP